MARCGLTEYAPRFKAIAQSGLCTMSPQIGRWLRKAWGKDSGRGESMNTRSLKELVTKLLTESCHYMCVSVEVGAHDAVATPNELQKRLSHDAPGRG